MTKSKEYWTKRMEILEEAQHKKGAKYLQDLDVQYRNASKEIEKQLSVWYQRFAKNNNVSMAEARKILKAKELAELKWDLAEYIKYGKENAINQRWVKELENASARVHITRLEAIQLQLQQQIEVLYGNQIDEIDDVLREIYENGYYHTAYEVQKGLNVGWSLQALDQDKLSKVLSKPWTMDKKTFSSRIWGNKTRLLGELQTELAQSVIMGKSPEKMIGNIAKKLNTSRYQAGRLVMTESAAISSASQRDAFKELDVEWYEIVATLDSRTSEICRSMDGQVFEMKYFQVGVTAPPFHPWCRTTTVPSFEDELSGGSRAARGVDGKTYYVPSDMKYQEWYNKYVFDSGKFLDSLIGIRTITGTDICGAKAHLIERSMERGIDVSHIEDALTKPLKVDEVVVRDDGKRSQRYIGEGATVNINPDTGYIITTWKTGKRTLKKLKR